MPMTASKDSGAKNQSSFSKSRWIYRTIKDKEEQGIEQRPPMMIKHVCYGCILWLLYAMTKYIVDKEISRAILWGLGRDCRCKENEAMTN